METPKLESLNKNTIREKYISTHFPEFYIYIMEHYPSTLTWSEKLYWYYNGLTKIPVCVVCGKRVKYVNIKEGYKKYCSDKCACNSKEVREKSKQTWLNKYGVENSSYDRRVIEMRSKTQRERYGGVGFASKELMNKTKKTNLERYGYEYAFQNPEIQERQKQTCLERYGVESSFAAEEVKEKIKQTNLEKYGVENPGWTEESQQKIKQTNLKKYGYENAFQNPVIQEKARQKCLNKYGVENPFQSKEVKEKIKQTLFQEYGVDHPSKSKEIRERAEQTCLKHHGVRYYTQTSEYKEKSYNTKKINHSFNSSKIEEDFASWLTENNITFKRQYKSKKYPFACDFYFPNKDLYLEIQGNWTHGHHPYDPNNQDDQEVVNFWKSKGTEFYDNAIKVWTESDTLKRKVAKENDLNWVEIFSCNLDDVITLYETS